MSQHTAQDEPVEDTIKPDFTPLPVTTSHTIAHAAAMPRARLEDNSQQHVVNEQQIRRIREIEEQVTADDYQERSCFDCPNFPNPALITFQRLQSALEQQSTAETENMMQRNAVMAASVSPGRFADGLENESIPQQRCESNISDVAKFGSPRSLSQRNHSSVRSVSIDHSQNTEAIATHSAKQQVPLSSSGELPEPTPNLVKRRRIMPTRYTYSHDEIWRLRHYNRSLDARTLGASAVIVLTEDPVPPTPIRIDQNLLFADMYLSQPIMNALRSLSFRRPSPIQQAAIPRGRFGCDMIAHAKSGTGKTIAFIVIVLESLLSLNIKKGGFTSVLILVPTRELTDQVANVFRSLSKFMNPMPRVLVVKGGTPEAIDEQQLSLTSPHVVIGTPGRVIMLIQKGVFVVDHINLLVLDEADRLAESAFSHSVPEICAMLPSRRQTVAFSATFEPWLRDMLLKVMRSPAFFSFPTSTHSNDDIDMLRRAILDKVRQYKIPVSGSLDTKLERVTALLSKSSFKFCIAFMNDKRYVAKVLMHLKNEGFQTGIMNATLDQRQRDRTILHIKQGKLQIIVASDLLARGLDFEDCDLILQLDVPYNPATYLHRVGRAGRYGRNGSSFLLYNTRNDERNQVLMLETSLGSKIAVVDNLNARNLTTIHRLNESQNPQLSTSVPAASRVCNSRSSQVSGESHMKDMDNIRHSRGIARPDADIDEAQGSLQAATSNSTTFVRTETPLMAKDMSSFDSHTTPVNNTRDLRVRVRDLRTTIERSRDHLRGSVVEKKCSPKKMDNLVRRKSGAPGYAEDDEEKRGSQDSDPRSRPSSANRTGPCNAPRLRRRDPRRGRASDSEHLDMAKMVIEDKGREETLRHADIKGKEHPESSCAPKGVSSPRANEERKHYRLDMRNETSHKLVSSSDKALSRDSSETPIDDRIESGADTVRELVPVSKENTEDRIQYLRSERHSDMHKTAGQDKEVAVNAAEHEPYDMWDAYARDAYAAGFREAYGEAFRMRRDLQESLQDTHT